MSKQLTLSAALSVLMMCGFVVFGTVGMRMDSISAVTSPIKAGTAAMPMIGRFLPPQR